MIDWALIVLWHVVSADGRFSRYKIQDDDETNPLIQDEEEGGEEDEEEGEDEVFPPDHSCQAAPAIAPLKRQQNEPSDPKNLVASGNGVIWTQAVCVSCVCVCAHHVCSCPYFGKIQLKRLNFFAIRRL